MNFVKKSPCPDCPYRKDAPLRKWHIAEFINLSDEDKKQFGKVFGCHKKDEHICVGYLMNQDERRFPNLNLRILLSKNNVTREYFDKLKSPCPVFDSIKEMIIANYPEIKKKIK